MEDSIRVWLTKMTDRRPDAQANLVLFPTSRIRIPAGRVTAEH
jgi:hypothetical protein